MKTSNISYLRNHLSEVLTCVKEGESVLVLDRKKPVACLAPYTAAGDALTTRLKELQNQGLLTHEPSDTPPKLPRPLKLSSSVDVARFILDDRENS
jgi:antitoxin (DNA-binding transcriptional repressor) of toxin-antitoxin stability system